MTTIMLKSIRPSDLSALHSVYAAIHQAHRAAPKLFTLDHCTTVMTALMSSQAWSWRVIGITPAALRIYKEQDFKHKSKQGITRGHVRRRIDTVLELLAPKLPMSRTTFIETLLRHDATILCASGENKHPIPEYIPFANEDAALFSSKKIGWSHTKNEQAFLRALLDRSSLQNAGQSRVKNANGAARNSGNGHGEFDRSLLKTEWPIEEIARRRAMHHRVQVGGKVFSSLWQAWKTLGLPPSDHQAFRKALKLAGRLTYGFGNKAYLFEIVGESS